MSGLYPVILKIEGRRAVVIGGGTVASRKIVDLLRGGAQVTCIAPEISDEIIELKNNEGNALEVYKRSYRSGDLEGAFIVYSATGDREVNRAVFSEAEERKVIINAVDDPENCSFYIPSCFSRGDLIVSVSTSGSSPAMAARLRRDIEKVIPDNIEVVLAAFREAREVLKNGEGLPPLSFQERGALLKKIASDDKEVKKLIAAHKTGSITHFLQKNLKG